MDKASNLKTVRGAHVVDTKNSKIKERVNVKYPFNFSPLRKGVCCSIHLADCRCITPRLL